MFAKADEVGCSPNVVGQLYKIMAMLCFDMHRFNDAILNFIKSEKIIGIDMEVLQRKALSYSMSGDTIAGIEVANQMKLFAPTDYLGYRIAFNILLQEERLEEAEKNWIVRNALLSLPKICSWTGSHMKQHDPCCGTGGFLLAAYEHM